MLKKAFFLKLSMIDILHLKKGQLVLIGPLTIFICQREWWFLHFQFQKAMKYWLMVH